MIRGYLISHFTTTDLGSMVYGMDVTEKPPHEWWLEGRKNKMTYIVLGIVPLDEEAFKGWTNAVKS